MNNNKNRLKDRPKSNAEERKMHPKDNSDLGIINGEKIGAHAQSKNPHKTYEWLNN
ncbi:hypothetical protein [Clostridium chauvoei]|uniref:Uncharacterized protein n=2 Tax=Clostridium chauvoei TaxID=46867 RepID=S6FN18_9CLOT|nr:hypothetical protein [Clostridium chauvoei]MBX7279654.1 hypothetical protein [Clostridium chauvoei]MBX7282023.1 hypothetical protein [Clostridium chauvoei]MBX7284388.1 hypothetical protein [Clostridium chauvoei]MBX7287067.1 hypothetical protein [Clostridium chauvoei]MBX7289742.1 hypothetical protein [Clostridium chauvoei]